MKYRSEIDGLRALAVIPVILLHAGFGTFSGGFVGVDIFFVISGYLITRILLTEIERGDFSIVRFYERRMRRICPALFLVLAVCIPLAWMWMAPHQFRDFGRSIVAVVFFVSNFLFWNEGGYFSAPAELKPLLHTWSLGVEEQYYLFAPLSLLLMWRFGRNVVFWGVIATAVVSLIAAEWASRYAPSANFYWTPFRVWELLAGSICGFLSAGRAPRRNNGLSAAGLALIIFAIFMYDESTPFPSFYALVPVGGAALILMYGTTGTWVARLLSTRLFVGIGVISYSAYLWHQPFFAFARIRSMAAPSPWLMLALAALSLVAAYFSWRFVEQPFRKRPMPWLSTRRSLFATSAALGTLFAAFGIYGSVSNGIPSRVMMPPPGSREAMLLDTTIEKPLAQECWTEAGVDVSKQRLLCPVFSPPNPKLRILVVGDSHSRVILPAFAAIGRESAVSWMGIGSCPPILDVAVRGSAFPMGVCADVARRQLETARTGGFNVVVLAARWSNYANSIDNRVALYPLGETYSPRRDSHDAFAAYLPRTVQAYSDLGIAVLVIDQIPEQSAYPQKIVQQAVFLGRGGVSESDFERLVMETSQPVEADRQVQGFTEAVMAKLAGKNVWFLSFDKLFEKDGRYIWGDRNGSYYLDNNHISLYGTKLMEAPLAAAFSEIYASLHGQ